MRENNEIKLLNYFISKIKENFLKIIITGITV